MKDQTITKAVEFCERYKQDDIEQTVLSDSKYLQIDHGTLTQYDSDLAYDALENPGPIIDALETATERVGSIEEPLTVGLTNLPSENVLAPGQTRHQHGGKYIAIEGVLERVTSPSDFPQRAVFECLRCPDVTVAIEQHPTQDDLQQPHECPSCERQGPWDVKHDDTEWADYAKLRIKSHPDVSDDESGTLTGFVMDELLEQGGENGILGRAGEPVTVYGVVRRSQKSGRGENKLLHDHHLEVKAIEFDRDENTVEIEEHKDEFTDLANQSNAVDLFAESIAPQLHATDEWEAAMEFAVAYLFGAPRIDIPQGPTYRGDLHFLIISDYGMGKSTFKEEIQSYSPKCLSKSTTALSSDVGLTAAAVKDGFGDGQWTIKPGLLVRANNGHLILDEIDKGPDELTNMNDALEGEQVVDIEKAGQSATYESRTAVMALGNPVEGRFDPNTPISTQIGISETLLSRFDGIVTMEDTPDKEQDAKIAETHGKAYTEAQAKQYGERDEFDALERPVSVETGKAWIKYARENIDPILPHEHFEELKEWYAEEARQMNHDFASDGDGENMPVPTTVRLLQSVMRMSIAFARCRLNDEVQPEQVERAKALGRIIVKQNWDGEKFNAAKESQQSGMRNSIMDALDNETWMFTDEIARESNVDETNVKRLLERLQTEQNPPKVEEQNGKWRVV